MQVHSPPEAHGRARAADAVPARDLGHLGDQFRVLLPKLAPLHLQLGDALHAVREEGLLPLDFDPQHVNLFVFLFQLLF